MERWWGRGWRAVEGGGVRGGGGKRKLIEKAPLEMGKAGMKPPSVFITCQNIKVMKLRVKTSRHRLLIICVVVCFLIIFLYNLKCF